MEKEFDAVSGPGAALTALERIDWSVERHVHRMQDATTEKLDLTVTALVATPADDVVRSAGRRPRRHLGRPPFIVRREATALGRRCG